MLHVEGQPSTLVPGSGSDTIVCNITRKLLLHELRISAGQKLKKAFYSHKPRNIEIIKYHYQLDSNLTYIFQWSRNGDEKWIDEVAVRTTEKRKSKQFWVKCKVYKTFEEREQIAYTYFPAWLQHGYLVFQPITPSKQLSKTIFIEFSAMELTGHQQRFISLNGFSTKNTSTTFAHINFNTSEFLTAHKVKSDKFYDLYINISYSK